MKTLFGIAALLFFGMIAQAQPRLVRVLGQLYSINSSWEDSAERLLSYNGTGQPYEHIINFKPNTSSAWLPGRKEINAYSSTGLVNTTTVFEWNNATTAWATSPFYTVDYTYNTASMVEKMEWNYSTGPTNAKDSFVYNTSGQLVEKISALNKTLYTYNSAGELTQTLVQSYTGSVWKDSHRWWHNYNTAGVLTYETFDYWDVSASAWVSGAFKNVYTYNTDGTLAEMLTEHWYNNTAHNFKRDLYFYTTATGLRDAADENIFTVFPNPSQGSFLINGDFDQIHAEIFIYDMAGRLVVRQNAEGNNTGVNVQGVAKGVYMLQVKTPAGTGTRRIIIE